MNKRSLADESSAYWESVYREAPVNTIASVKEGAKQLVTITSSLQGLFFVALSFGDIKSAVQGWWVLPFALPVALWLVCLALAVSVFVPESHHVARRPDSIERAFRSTARDKLRLLQCAQWLLVVSMVLLAVDLLLYLLWIPAPAS